MKRKRIIVRAVSLFMVGLITTLALVIPTSAIMTEYPTEDNNTYADCVMPFNVNFVGTDGTLDYVYSVPVGYNSPVVQTGTQGHETLTGRVLGDGGVTPNTASLEYYYYPTEWRIGYDGTEYDDGWGGVPVTLHIDNTDLDGKTIVIEAPTFYVNPLVSNWYNVSNTDTYNRWAMGAFRMPALSDPTTQAYVGTYSVSANIVDDVGTKHPVEYSRTFDTRIDNDWVPMLEPSIFQDYVINSIQETGYNRIVAVTDFKAYVDYDYYELNVSGGLVGSWVVNQGWTATSGYLGYYDGAIIDGLDTSSFCIGYEHESFTNINPTANYCTWAVAGRYANSVTGSSFTVEITQNAFESPSNADKNDKLLTWLVANATKQGGSSAEGGEWQIVTNSPLKATGIDVSYPVYDRYTFDNDTDLALNLGYPDFNRYISKFRGIGNIDNNVDFTGWIATATSGFLNFELLPNFSIGGVLAILVGFSLVILFLKIFAGG